MPTREQKRWQHFEENRLARQVQKQIKNNRKPDRVRRSDWMTVLGDLDDTMEADLTEFERIMPIGERERRRSNQRRVEVAPESTLTEEPDSAPATAQSSQTGLVIEVSTGLCRVRMEESVLLCTVRGSLSAEETGYTNLVAVGDRVAVEPSNDDQGVITEVLARRTALMRPDVFRTHLQQVVAANVDQLLIVAAWREPALWPELVDRYLIAAARSRLVPIICVNKVDLAESLPAVERFVEPYRRLEYDLVLTSAATGEGIPMLRKRLLGRTTALAGLSGVGKSSLLSAVEPGFHLRTAEVSERQHAGRHTTTQVSLMPLTEGGFVVDTPGIREFGLSGLHVSELQEYYAEIQAVARGCRYVNCSHLGEPGCAVEGAVATGQVSHMRLASFHKIRRSLPA